MSIFSRLFNKNGDGDEKGPANEEASPDVKQEGNSRKPPAPATTATEVKAATMRPAAPSFTPPLLPIGYWLAVNHAAGLKPTGSIS